MSRLAGSMAVVLLTMGVLGSAPALAGIKDTKHNLGSSAAAASANRINSFDGTAEICVFCHTPHGSDTSAAIPLWNRSPGSATYTTYNSLGTSSLDGATAPVGSVSLACLSCHDGTQAMNTMINAPGSGLAGNAAYQAGSWSGANNTGGNQGKLGGLADVTLIGVDLRNDHPVGIQYAGGPKGAASTIPASPNPYTKSLFKDNDFHDASSSSLNGKQVWWIDTAASGGVGGTSAREKTDIQLYSRGGSGADAVTATFTDNTTVSITAPQPFVECASCHDPHSSNETFLRIPNTGSQVCLACHDK